VRLESEHDDASLVRLVGLSELFGYFRSGDRRSRWVEDVDYELTAGEESVCGEFPGADGDGGRAILEHNICA
jgi:hypothetical protein